MCVDLRNLHNSHDGSPVPWQPKVAVWPRIPPSRTRCDAHGCTANGLQWQRPPDAARARSGKRQSGSGEVHVRRDEQLNFNDLNLNCCSLVPLLL